MVRSKIENIKEFKIKILDREIRIFEMNNAVDMIILKNITEIEIKKTKTINNKQTVKGMPAVKFISAMGDVEEEIYELNEQKSCRNQEWWPMLVISTLGK